MTPKRKWHAQASKAKRIEKDAKKRKEFRAKNLRRRKRRREMPLWRYVLRLTHPRREENAINQ